MVFPLNNRTHVNTLRTGMYRGKVYATNVRSDGKMQ